MAGMVGRAGVLDAATRTPGRCPEVLNFFGKDDPLRAHNFLNGTLESRFREIFGLRF